MEQMQRQADRRKNIRRGVIVAIVAVLILGTGALLFSNKTTTTTIAGGTTTTTVPVTVTTLPKSKVTALQTAANAKAVSVGCPASTATRVNNLSWPKAPAMTINRAKTYTANFVTTAGNFAVKLDAAKAPITTNNFVYLAEHKFYNCVIFHRAIPGFMIQGGDPSGTGTSGPGYTIADEYPKAASPTYPLYSLAMANTGRPHTGGSQFFIVTGAIGETLSAAYSLFGQVVSGQSVVKTIQNEGNPSQASNGVPPLVTQRILTITITES